MKTRLTGSMLVSRGLITEEQLNEALTKQRGSTKKIGEILVEAGYIEEQDIMKLLEAKLNVDYVDLKQFIINKESVWMINEETARKYCVIAIETIAKTLIVATVDPMNFMMLEELKMQSGCEIKPVLATRSEILDAIEEFYGGSYKASSAMDEMSTMFGVTTETQDDSNANIEDAPIVKFVNSMLLQAAQLNASDIHVEPMESITRVRMRVDGVLNKELELPVQVHPSLITRLKIISGMDIAERRIPQDGRYEYHYNDRKIDMRFSDIPTVFGEKMVIRLLGSSGVIQIEDLGLSERNMEMLKSILQTSYGMLLICGPTGSGKTTTVYSVLDRISTPQNNTMTVEDPVEYNIEGINQVQVNTKAGLDFASALRSFLRQDPDIIMVGEIRDGETATIATRSAITGHFVISTIHTNDAASAISRLTNMGIDNFMVSASTVGIVSQRLVRVLCPHCKKETVTDENQMRLLNLSEPMKVYEAVGCMHCNDTGYKGRKPVHEIIRITPEQRSLIDSGGNTDDIRKLAIQQGTITLQDCCLELVKKGEVSVSEMLKATYVIS